MLDNLNPAQRKAVEVKDGDAFAPPPGVPGVDLEEITQVMTASLHVEDRVPCIDVVLSSRL